MTPTKRTTSPKRIPPRPRPVRVTPKLRQLQGFYIVATKNAKGRVTTRLDVGTKAEAQWLAARAREQGKKVAVNFVPPSGTTATQQEK